MGLYQNSTVDATKLILGNCKIETAATAGGTYVNLGAGIVNSFTYTPTMYDVQAGNAPDPIEGISAEEATIEAELIEYDASVLSAISGGMWTQTSTTSQSTLKAGGNLVITPRAFKLTSTRLTSAGVTQQTIITVFKAKLTSGLAINFKSDNDTDPIAVMPISVQAKKDTTLSVGTQLFSIVRDL